MVVSSDVDICQHHCLYYYKRKRLPNGKKTETPNKEIEEAIIYAEKKGWAYKDSGKSAHAWGKLLCPLHAREGHKMSIWSTPRNTFNHAQQIKRLVDKCQHETNSEDNE